MDPAISNATLSEMDLEVNVTKEIMKAVDFTAAFKAAFTTLWHAKLPCFDTVNMSALNEGDRGILKYCSWKGDEVPCSAIFTTFPTDQGMCCSFNMKAADDIFVDSKYSKLVKELQKFDYDNSFENSTLPETYTSRGEPKTQSGRNMGLKVVLDAHSDTVESFSISRDFEGFTVFVMDPGSFPLSNLKGFEVKPGHNNLVAVSAQKIDADDDLRGLKPATRKCLFPDETDHVKLHKSYSQANCYLECSLIFAQNKLAQEQNMSQGCTPWYFPFTDDSYRMCDPFETSQILDRMQNDVPSDECNYCLPGVNKILP
jgi:acid-sensing ion channel, other